MCGSFQLIIKNRIPAIAVPIALCLLFVGSVLYRVSLSEWSGHFDPNSSIAFYWTENALQYHYTELVAKGQQIPSLDQKLQAPEGVKVFENLTIMMEYPCGFLYRVLGLEKRGFLLHRFTIRFMAFIASLTLFAVYLFCRALGYSRVLSILASALSAFATVSVRRSIGGYLNEDFALPLFFLGMSLFFYAFNFQKKSSCLALIAGLFFSLSLASWHLSRFLFLGFISCAIVLLWVLSLTPSVRSAIVRNLALVIALQVLVGLAVPVLRSKLFFVSPPIAIGLGALLGIWIFKPTASRPVFCTLRGWLAIATTAIILVLCIAFSNHLGGERDFIHVWSLLLDKVRFFGTKPLDPGQLDYPARSLWIEAFNSPGLTQVFIDFFPTIIFSVIGFVLFLKIRKRQFATYHFLIMSVLFLLLYLAIERMGIVANFFICILAASAGTLYTELEQIHKTPMASARILSAIGLVATLIFNSYQGLMLNHQTRYVEILRKLFGSEQPSTISNSRINDIDLVYFIRERTEPDAIFLARYGVEPLILAYANRAIALQPKFEVRGSKEKVKEYYETIYDNEEKLYELCRTWHITYLLHDIKIALDNTKDSDRWVADCLDLPKSSVAFSMQFAPWKLKHFELVYESYFYRLFRVLPPTETARGPAIQQSIYDVKQFGDQNLEGGYFNDCFTQEVIMRIRKASNLLQSAQVVMTRDPQRALQMMIESRNLYPMLIGSATTLGVIYVLLDELKEGLKLCQMEVEQNPWFPLARYNLAYGLINAGNNEAAKKELEEALRLDPRFEPARVLLCQVELMQK